MSDTHRFRVEPMHGANIIIDDNHEFPSIRYNDPQTKDNKHFRLSDYPLQIVDDLFDNRITRYLAENPKARVLDIACGYRYTPLLTIAQNYPNVHATGIDIAIQERDIPDNLDVMQMDARDITLLEPGFDLIYSHQFIQHMWNGMTPEKGRFYSNVAALLSKKGIALLDDYFLAKLPGNLDEVLKAKVDIGRGQYEGREIDFLEMSNSY